MLMTKPNKKRLNEYVEELQRQRRDEIRRLYTAYRKDKLTGWTIEKIAAEYGITKQRVWQIVEDIAERYNKEKDPD